MSHTTVAATRDYTPVADKGELMDPAQSAGFVSDPLLTPITTSSRPHPIAHPEPSLDPSTHHPNDHYDPEKKLSKKKRAKKFGVGSVHPPAHATYTGGRSFAETDREHHERAERRDHHLAQRAQEEEGEEGDEEEDEDHDANEDELAASHNAHHENRVAGTERQHESRAPAESKPRHGAAMKHSDVAPAAEKAEGGAAAQKSHDGAQNKEEGQKEGHGDAGQQTMMGKASGLLSSAQEKASAVLGSVTQQPIVSSLLSRVGLGGSGNKAEDSTKQDNAQAKKEEEA